RCLHAIACFLPSLSDALSYSFVFFFNAPSTTDIYTLSLHDALPIYLRRRGMAEEYAADIVFAAVVGGIVGAKIWYVLLTGEWEGLLRRGGFVWYGGFLGGVEAVLALGWGQRVPARWTMGSTAAHRAPGAGVGRAGCGRGALPGGDRACQGRSAVGTVHAGAGHERVARARGPVADAAAAGGRAGDRRRASRAQAAAAGPGHALAAGYGNDGRRRSAPPPVPPTRLRCSHTTATSSRTRSRSCSASDCRVG